MSRRVTLIIEKRVPYVLFAVRIQIEIHHAAEKVAVEDCLHASEERGQAFGPEQLVDVYLGSIYNLGPHINCVYRMGDQLHKQGSGSASKGVSNERIF